MVNYLYDLPQITQNHERFATVAYRRGLVRGAQPCRRGGVTGTHEGQDP